jgi:hypothetical protein
VGGILSQTAIHPKIVFSLPQGSGKSTVLREEHVKKEKSKRSLPDFFQEAPEVKAALVDG